MLKLFIQFNSWLDAVDSWCASSRTRTSLGRSLMLPLCNKNWDQESNQSWHDSFEVFLVKLSFKCTKACSFLAASKSILMPKYGISAPLPYKLATCFHPNMRNITPVLKGKCILDAIWDIGEFPRSWPCSKPRFQALLGWLGIIRLYNGAITNFQKSRICTNKTRL